MVYCPVCKGSGKLFNGVEGNKAFSNLDELWSILNPSKAETEKTEKHSKSLKEGEQGENKH